MFQDDAFFGYARAGSIDGHTQYPVVLDTERDVKVTGDTIEVLGERFRVSFNAPLASTLSAGYQVSGDIVLLYSGYEGLQRPGRLMRVLREIRSKYGFSKLVYLQGPVDPYTAPVLTYLGISIFDDFNARLEGMNGVRYTQLGRLEVGEDVSEWNSKYLKETVGLLRGAIIRGTLREAVEKVAASSRGLELLRRSDAAYGEFEQVFPRRTKYILSNSLEALYRPDLVRYREYIRSSYVRPQGWDVALLIPCSARKPYSSSSTHRRIEEFIGDIDRGLHRVVITSPVGVVPIELEETYPPRFYDIPVIGHWYEDEKMMIRDTLVDFLSRNQYRAVVVFVDEDLAFLSDYVPRGSEIIIGDIRDERNLRALRERLLSLLPGKGESIERETREKYQSIMRYQFGDWILPYLREARVVRQFNQDMLVVNGKPYLVYNKDMGKFTVHRNAASIFVENSKFLVGIDDFKPTANVYAVGVRSATEDIRQEDEVVIHHEGEVRGVGIAKMPYQAMVQLKKGIAVKVRN